MGRWVSRSNARLAGGIVDCFNESQATAAFSTVADWLRIARDGVEEILEDSFVTANVRDRRRGGALVGVARCGGGKVRRRVAQIGGDDAIVFEDYSAFRAGDFEAARVAGIGGGSSEKCANSSVGKFQSSYRGIFCFDFVQYSGGPSADASDIAEQP